ncbi:non-ribosomal peptide synthetase [Priestia megaterium]|uniref:non-ribosomal peptide synthetase n=1 Tax=Priestia megaterium TaxID=1404 RepID=UPI00101D8D15|nr:non-ribosomal peptide synthetase [Priestia megaterium]
MLEKKNIKDLYELSPLQKGILFHHLENPKSHSYFEQMTLTMKGKVDVQCLEDGLNALIEKYDILRTAFISHSFKNPMQIVLKERKTKIHYQDIAIIDEDSQKEYLEKFKTQDKQRGFDLSSDILIRFSLFKVADATYKLVWSHHHIILDGWCLDIILNDLFEFYEAYLSGSNPNIGKTLPYNTYIKWQQKQNKGASQAYWDQYVANYEGSVGVPKQSLNHSKKHNAGKVSFHLGESLTASLIEVAKNNHITLSTAFQTVWGILLQKYNSVDDVCFGTIVAGRPAEIPHVEEIVGLFINTIPVRVQSDKNENIISMMKKLQNDTLKSDQHSHLSFSDISRNASEKSQMIDHVIIVENYPLNLQSINNKVSFDIEDIDVFEQTNYDFDLTVYPGEDLHFVCTYNKNVYDDVFIQKLGGHIKEVIVQFVNNPYLEVSDVSIITQDEKNEILNNTNHTNREFLSNRTIQEIFEEQVSLYPSSPALVFDGVTMTYQELNERANQCANHLRKVGVSKNEFVGVMINRSLEMIVGILSVIKAGAAYVPIDRDYPGERIDFILQDSKAKYLLTDNASKTSEFEGHTILINDPVIYKESKSNIQNMNSSSDMAYMIYTSGSTGKPKGVVIGHRELHALTLVADRYGIKPGERVLQTASLSFDASVGEIFFSLLNGATLYLVQKDFMLSGQRFMTYLKDESINSIQFVPSMLKALPYMDLPDLKVISTGGEALTKELVETWGKGRHFLNAYGPTETTVDATHAIYYDGKIDKVHIGKPILNKQAYILDKNKNMQPVGIAGELYIGGEGISRGYWNRPDVTDTAFVDNPFIEGGKMYRTGDLVRLLSDGNIEYLGRNDHQCKVRGYRIELGEIEEHLRSYSSIKDAAVVVHKEEIHAYFVSNNNRTNVVEFNQYMRKRLPDYMVPSTYNELDQLPLNPNGKINKKLLVIPDRAIVNNQKIALNRTEEELLKVWEEVLERRDIGYTDSFFSLGGHSLKAMMLMSRIQKVFQVEISLKTILEKSTIRNLAQCIKHTKGSTYQSILPVEGSEYYPVSSVQKRIYTIQQFQGIGTSYNIPVVIDLEGELNLKALNSSLKEVVNRHESLRTSFHMVEGSIKQKVHPEVYLEFKVIQSSLNDMGTVIHNFMSPFDLSKAPLLRAGIIKIEKQRHVLLLDMNHIIADGLSIDIIIDELKQVYNGNKLPELGIQYKDYSVWQSNLLHTEEMKKQKEYWLNKFDGALPNLELPTDFSRPSIRQYEGAVHTFNLDSELRKQIKSFTERHNISSYVLLLAAYKVLLSKYAREEDIIVGITTSGRSHPDLEPIVGMLAQTLALRNYADERMPFMEFLLKVKDSVFEALENTDYPLDELLNNLTVKRDVSRNPLFDTMFVLENSSKETHRFNGMKHQVRNMEWNNAKLDLTWYVQENDEQLQILIEFSSVLFKEETIKRMSTQFSEILSSVLENPEKRLKEVELISKKEKEVILSEFNNTAVKSPPFKPLHVVFEEQVKRTPDNVALLFDNKQLTYRDLNSRVNQVARHLRAKGVNKNVVVGVLMERSFEMIIGIISILKAGGAYMPIAPNFPKDRMKYMVENSEVKLILTQQNFKNITKSIIDDFICLDDEKLYVGETCNLSNLNEESDLSYVLYTSGSTGKPKGVMIEHFNVINRINWMVKEYGISEKDTLIQKTPYVFDVSVWELFMWFFTGARLCLLAPGEEKSPDKIIQSIEKFNVTSIHFVPSMFNGFLEYMEIDSYFERLGSLTRIFTSGEALLPKQVERFNCLSHPAGLYNLYGPTEATVDVSYFNCPNSLDIRVVPIGKPIDNVELYVVDSNNHLQPIGVPGELCISGKCLARGYINRNDLTKEKFVQNPFVNGERMYRTGDLARWMPDGNIEYLGRIDNQVKIRGYRIELDEITEKLLEYNYVKEGVTITRTDSSGAPYICAYYVSEKELDIPSLKVFLGKHLPEYMIPTYFIQISRMPLTHNGKLDRAVLPEPEFKINRHYVQPTSEQEMMLAQIWKEVLNLKEVGITDNFFEMGGDSIKAISVVAQLSKHNIKVEMTDFFKNPTINDLIPYLKEKDQKAYQGIVSGEQGMTPIQKWFFHQKLENFNHWNQSVLLHNKGAWKPDLLRKTFSYIIEHHDALRIVFKKCEDEIRQLNRSSNENVFEMIGFDIEHHEDIKQCFLSIGQALHTTLNIEEGPLVRLAHIKTPDGEYLLIVVHHLLIDGVSWRILLEDFSTIYNQIETNNRVDLPEKTTPYLEWSKQLYKYASSTELLSELPYWKDIDQASVVSLEKCGEHKNSNNTENNDIKFSIDKDLTDKLLTSVHKAYHTEINDILLTALALAVKNNTNHSLVTLNLEGHGREEIIDGIDLSRTVGWFTTIYPVLFDLKDTSLSTVIKTVKETLRNVPNKGIGYGILKYLSQTNYSFTLKPEILFNYLGQFNQKNNDEVSISNLSPGQENSDYIENPYTLEINGRVLEGIMSFILSYDSNKINYSTVLELKDEFIKNLKRIVKHCESMEVSEATPSDFTVDDLSLEELEDIFEVLK